MAMTEHTIKAFDADLQELARMIAEMGGMAERLIGDSVDALRRRDTALSQSVIAADTKIDALQREIEEKAILTIARRQPMAVDLRDVVGALASPTISSASATSPRISPSGSKCSTAN